MLVRRSATLPAPSHSEAILALVPNSLGTRLTIKRRTLHAPVADATIRTAKKLRQARRSRATIFPAHLAAGPAWDMLLALYLAHAEQYRMNITDLTNACGTPPTTALRWVATLIEKGFARRYASNSDGRVHFVEITERATKLMTQYLELAGPRLLAA